ncbi:Uncharacterized protein XB16_2597 [Leptospira santarosai]|uniref:Uncharacterized protein n=1 Tax=Leptospira santarosai TaxID=28183 RepID=A0A2P1QVI0_9LEPT|nr:Uncharacterized protein XB16_2597 [Leptospira santarosai]AVV50614.1 Uncharacterized protein XB17_02030 [Leptospira santarosai]
MSQTSPWHSIKENHHHNNTQCGPGSQVLLKNRQSGTGNKPLCLDCSELNKKNR